MEHFHQIQVSLIAHTNVCTYCMYVITHQHITYMLHTGKHPVSHPSVQACTHLRTYMHAYVFLFVRVYPSLSLPFYMLAFLLDVIFLFVHCTRPVTKALKIFPANNKLKLANTHNFCYMYMCMCTNTHTHANKHMHAYVLTYIRVRVFIHEVRRMREYGNFAMAKLESQCVHVYVNTYIHAHSRIGSLGTQIQTYVHLFVHTFRQKLNTYICILYRHTHIHTPTYAWTNGDAMHTYEVSYIHTYKHMYKQNFILRAHLWSPFYILFCYIFNVYMWKNWRIRVPNCC